MVLNINNSERIYSSIYRNLSLSGYRTVFSGCDVSESTVPAMSADVTSGVVNFGTIRKTVTGGTVTIEASDLTNPRFDLIAVDSSGNLINPTAANNLKGVASADPVPNDSYTSTDYVIIGIVTVGAGVTTILNVNIKDMRVFNTSSDISSSIISAAQNASQILRITGSYINEDYILADEFTSNAGLNSTVNTGGSTTAQYANGNTNGSDDGAFWCQSTNVASTDTLHTTGTWTNPTNVFDLDDTTFGSAPQASYAIGKTFGAKTIGQLIFRFSLLLTGGSGSGTVNLQTFDGAIWTTVSTLVNTSLQQNVTKTYFKTYYLNSSVQGVRLSMNITGLGNASKFYIFDYGDYSDSNVLCDSNTLSLDGTENGFVPYTKTLLNGSTSLAIDISDGSTTVSGSEKTYNDISSLSSGTLELTHKLKTTNVKETPVIFRYSGVIIK